MPTPTPPKYLTPQQVADGLSLHRETVYDLIAAGEFPGTINVGGEGSQRRLRIPLTSYERFIASREVAA